MVEQLKQSLTARGYKVFTRPFELNIIGVRSASNVPNAFDDHINVFFVDGAGNWQFKSYEATTDPGAKYLKTPINADGTAILKPGQYKDCYAIGLHRSLYMALVQRRPVTVIRDFNRDSIPDYTTGKEQTGMFGINIHRAQERGRTKVVDGFSAGCQVFADIKDFQEFMQLAEAHKRLYGNVFTYTLLQASTTIAASAAAMVTGKPIAPLA